MIEINYTKYYKCQVENTDVVLNWAPDSQKRPAPPFKNKGREGKASSFEEKYTKIRVSIQALFNTKYLFFNIGENNETPC